MSEAAKGRQRSSGRFRSLARWAAPNARRPHHLLRGLTRECHDPSDGDFASKGAPTGAIALKLKRAPEKLPPPCLPREGAGP